MIPSHCRSFLPAAQRLDPPLGWGSEPDSSRDSLRSHDAIQIGVEQVTDTHLVSPPVPLARTPGSVVALARIGSDSVPTSKSRFEQV